MNNWDAWKKEWENASKFFNSKGVVATRSKLKDTWNKEFMDILQYFYSQGVEVSKKQALTSEIEFLENQIKNVKRHKSCVSCFRLLRTSEERIAKLKGALE